MKSIHVYLDVGSVTMGKYLISLILKFSCLKMGIVIALTAEIWWRVK